MDPTTMVDDGAPESTLSPIFCDVGADVAFRSSDNVLFRVYRQNIKMYSEAFHDANDIASESSVGIKHAEDLELVLLTERAEVLELLFQFMRLQQPPQLNALPFRLLFDLAEATEKYLVHGAIVQCRSHLRRWTVAQEFIKADTLLDMLRSADTHLFSELLDDMALMTIDLGKDQVAQILSGPYFKAWTLYQDQWIRFAASLWSMIDPLHTFFDEFACDRQGRCPCVHERWPHSTITLFRRLANASGRNLSALRKPERIFSYDMCSPWDDHYYVREDWDDGYETIRLQNRFRCCIKEIERYRRLASRQRELIKPLRHFLAADM